MQEGKGTDAEVEAIKGFANLRRTDEVPKDHMPMHKHAGAESVCPRCGRNGTLMARILVAFDVKMRQAGVVADLEGAERQETIIEEVRCTACDFTLDLTRIRRVEAYRPSCGGDCKFAEECPKGRKGRYQLTALLCSDFRWGPQNRAEGS